MSVISRIVACVPHRQGRSSVRSRSWPAPRRRTFLPAENLVGKGRQPFSSDAANSRIGAPGGRSSRETVSALSENAPAAAGGVAPFLGRPGRYATKNGLRGGTGRGLSRCRQSDSVGMLTVAPIRRPPEKILYRRICIAPGRGSLRTRYLPTANHSRPGTSTSVRRPARGVFVFLDSVIALSLPYCPIYTASRLRAA